MNKKHQVFISSTFRDLQEERKKVLDVLLMADCIPAGMEAFVATDNEQFNVIKKVIDLCDYYLLIIGGKYGSIDSISNKSYTEMEYEYAISQSIPVLVFALDSSIELPDIKKENDIIKSGKLEEFKNLAMKNRLASIWKDTSDLVGKVAIAIMQAKQEIVRPGWVRGGAYEESILLKQIVDLKNQNEILSQQLSELEKNDTPSSDLEITNFYGFKVALHYTKEITYSSIYDLEDPIKKEVSTTLDDVFKFISLRLTGKNSKEEFKYALDNYQPGFLIEEQEALILRNQFIHMGLFESTFDKKDNEITVLTDTGKIIMNKLNRLN